MSDTGAFPGSRCFLEFGQTKYFPGLDAVPAVPSQIVTGHWYLPPLTHYDPTGSPPGAEDVGIPSPERNIPLYPHNRGASPSSLESPFPHLQLHYGETARIHGKKSDHCGSSTYSSRERATSLPHTIDPRALINYSGTVFIVPRSTVERPQINLLKAPPNQGSSAKGSTYHTGGIWRFLKMRPDSKYECSWDDGSGKICGYPGTLLQVKRHLRSDHPFNGSTLCSFCKKTFSSVYSLKLHRNRHTGESPYKCQYCEEAFKSPNARKYHLITCHGHTPEKRRQEGAGN